MSDPKSQQKETKESKDQKDSKSSKDAKEQKEKKDTKDTKESKDSKDTKDGKEQKEGKDSKTNRNCNTLQLYIGKFKRGKFPPIMFGTGTKSDSSTLIIKYSSKIMELAAVIAQQSGRKTILERDVLAAHNLYWRPYGLSDENTFKPGKIPLFKRPGAKKKKDGKKATSKTASATQPNSGGVKKPKVTQKGK